MIDLGIKSTDLRRQGAIEQTVAIDSAAHFGIECFQRVVESMAELVGAERQTILVDAQGRQNLAETLAQSGEFAAPALMDLGDQIIDRQPFLELGVVYQRQTGIVIGHRGKGIADAIRRWLHRSGIERGKPRQEQLAETFLLLPDQAQFADQRIEHVAVVTTQCGQRLIERNDDALMQICDEALSQRVTRLDQGCGLRPADA